MSDQFFDKVSNIKEAVSFFTADEITTRHFVFTRLLRTTKELFTCYKCTKISARGTPVSPGPVGISG